MMENNSYIEFWQKWLGLSEWCINKNQVVYDDDVPNEDRYFVGVQIDNKNKSATIYHDRKLNHVYVLHELLHVKFPKLTEEQVNEKCDIILNNVSQL